MNLLNLFLQVKYFLKAKWIFQKPEKKKFLIYDYANSNIILKYIDKKQSTIYFTRWEEINFYILYYSVINYGLNNIRKNYKKAFFDFVDPKVVITLVSSQIAFFKLKKQFPNITFISIQNNVGTSEFIKFLKKAKNKSLSCDYFLFFSEQFRKMYKKLLLIKKKSVVIGSFRNNFYHRKFPIKKKLLFISKSNWNIKSPLNEIILLNFIVKFLKKNQMEKIDICMKTNDARVRDYYKKNLDQKYINILKKENNYLVTNNYENIIFTDSTLGYECLAKGKKIVSLNLGSLNKKWCLKNSFTPINKFGYPGNFRNEGFCWSNSCDEKRVNELLSNILNMKQSTFNKKIKKIKNKIMFYDPKNTKFKKLICVV